MLRVGTIFFIIGIGVATALPPENYPPSRYVEMVRNSAFTDPPDPPPKGEVVNDLEDWTLAGVSPFADGVRVRLINKKDRDQRVTIPSAESTELGFVIRKVEQDRNFLKTKVLLGKGSQEGWVEFDPQFMTLRRAAAPPRANNNQGQGGNRNQRNANNNNQPRRVSPPTPGSRSNNANSRGRQNNPSPVPNVNGRGDAQSGGGSAQNVNEGRTARRRRTRYVPRPRRRN